MKFYPPGNKPILPYFAEFESCFILFHPFVKLENDAAAGAPRVSSNKLTTPPDELTEALKNIPMPANMGIYASNEEYPAEAIILEQGIAVSWQEVLEASRQLQSSSDLLKALKTSIGAYRTVFQREDLMQALQKVLQKESLWSPQEDIVNPLTKKKLYDIFQFLQVEHVINEFSQEEKTELHLADMSANKFCTEVQSTLFYSSDKEIVIMQGRDTFFCLLLTRQQETMQRILDQFAPEGILCDPDTTPSWEFSAQEMEVALQKENEFPSSQHFIFRVLLGLPVMLSVGVAFFFLIHIFSSAVSLWPSILLGVTLAFSIFVSWRLANTMRNTVYSIKGNTLHYRCGINSGAIPIQQITAIRHATYPLAGNRPAWDIQGLQIFYGEGYSIFVSPKKKNTFVHKLKQINGNIHT